MSQLVYTFARSPLSLSRLPAVGRLKWDVLAQFSFLLQQSIVGADKQRFFQRSRLSRTPRCVIFQMAEVVVPVRSYGIPVQRHDAHNEEFSLCAKPGGACDAENLAHVHHSIQMTA